MAMVAETVQNTILWRLQQIWQKHPNIRLGQILYALKPDKYIGIESVPHDEWLFALTNPAASGAFRELIAHAEPPTAEQL